jgi:DHA1 family multidrug resistance protein-like MFS transporter
VELSTLSDQEKLKSTMRKNKELLILSLSLIVVMLGFGMVIPIFPFYIEELGAGGFELGLLAATSAVLEFIFGPVWGGVSDRIGRKPVLLIGMFGYALSALLFAVSTRIWMLFFSRGISGILSSAVITTALAYVSDATGGEERAGGMGKLSAAMAFGMIFGPAFGGLLGGRSIALPFFIACGMSVVAFFIILIFLPESLQVKSAQKHSGFKLGGRWAKLLALVRGPLGFLFILVMLYSFALSNFEAVFGLYSVKKFNFDTSQVGAVLTVVAVVSALGKALLSGPTAKKFGEEFVIKGSLIAGSVGYLSLLVAVNFTTILLATGFFILSKTLLRPASLSLISRRSQDARGTLMGAANSFMSLGRIIGPVWAGFIFDINVNLPYLSGSIFMFISFILCWKYLGKQT